MIKFFYEVVKLRDIVAFYVRELQQKSIRQKFAQYVENCFIQIILMLNTVVVNVVELLTEP